MLWEAFPGILKRARWFAGCQQYATTIPAMRRGREWDCFHSVNDEMEGINIRALSSRNGEDQRMDPCLLVVVARTLWRDVPHKSIPS